MTTQESLLTQLSDGVFTFREEIVREAAEAVVDNGFDIMDAILKGLSDGMARAGEQFTKQEYFVPELLMCAEVMEAGLGILKPHLPPKNATGGKGTILLGSVEGDIHTIGKNLVKLMLGIHGYHVVDLGVDVPLHRFVKEQASQKADIVGLSAMMTTTMLAMKKLVPMLQECNPKPKVLVGGAPVTEQVAALFGADGYAPDAVSACAVADKLMREKAV
ncbi:MAG: B12-binding domain-containing protein [Desulfopila sp.]